MSNLPEETHVGRVALSTADVDSAAAFYEDVVGLEAVDRDDDGAVLGAGGTPLLELEAAPEEAARPPNAAGLFHVAYRVPDRSALADALARVRASGRMTGASDHLVSEALYLDDPEDNGIEVYRDRPREEWERPADGRIRLDTLPLDLGDLATEAAGAETAPPGTDVGHVHLEVTDLDRARAFYVDALGFDVTFQTPGALFVAAGGYHHHVGLNTWNRRSAPAAGRGLDWFEVVLPDEATLAAAVDRLEDAGYGPTRTAAEHVPPRTDAGHEPTRACAGATVRDPDGIGVRLAVRS